ncbi:MAG: acyl-CoA dehydrogenase [Desulfatiglans sp.]|jgi:alkylation response protein AidB-like acyl-CoA dehydrogenase|nr:acyl-CoA dehydrogenase [Desulfatiglans sp.]
MKKLLIDDRDQVFVLFEQLRMQGLFKNELYSDFDEETCRMILREAERLAANVMMPTYRETDTAGCTLKDGKVFVPEVFKELWRTWNEGGWRRIDLPREIGGQGLPLIIGMAANEYFEAGNLAFQTLAAMARGAAFLIARHGTKEQKEKYVEKILSGQWTGTMVLTESEAGSDVGATKTVAVPNDDGTYNITGNKTFITGGDNNLVENIIHLTLARVKGSPPGTRGLSLFLVPKYRVNRDGSIGELNDTKVISIEKKMGLKGSPTCQMVFGEEGNCTGELVGEINKGMAIFFTMMNESRLIAARHGASIAATAYLHALNYSKERLQGREMGASPDSPQAPIIRHPDVRRMLLMMKAYTEGIRALILYTTYCMDMELVTEDKDEKLKWAELTAFLTPVAKAYGSDMSFRVTEAAMQVYGGYGYMKDYPVEQFLRDEKVHSIFEGTNGIQSLDLLARKVVKGFPGLDKGLFNDIETFCEINRQHKELAKHIALLSNGLCSLREVTLFLTEKAKQDFKIMALFATQYMELFGDVITGWLLLWQAMIAHEKLQIMIQDSGLNGEAEVRRFTAENSEAAFYSGKVSSARYFSSNIVSLSTSKARAIIDGDTAAIEMAEEEF